MDHHHTEIVHPAYIFRSLDIQIPIQMRRIRVLSISLSNECYPDTLGYKANREYKNNPENNNHGYGIAIPSERNKLPNRKR